jgi:hypothetical protein
MPVPISRRPRTLQILRFLALGLLVFGLLVKPVLAAQCELDDARRALGDYKVAVLDADAAGDEACCPGESCGECCTASTIVSPAILVIGAMPAPAGAAVIGGTDFAPAPYPVAMRPPITA